MITSGEKEKALSIAYNLAAQIVSLYGENYLPIFERLYQELENSKHKTAMLQRALIVSENAVSKNDSFKSVHKVV